MKYLVSSILAIFFLGVAFGLIGPDTSKDDLSTMFVDILDGIEETLDTVVVFGQGAIALFHNTVSKIGEFVGTVGGWVSDVVDWFRGVFFGTGVPGGGGGVR